MEEQNRRTDNDLESVEYGTPSRGGGKMYFNSRADTIDDIKRRIDLHKQALDYFKQNMGGVV